MFNDTRLNGEHGTDRQSPRLETTFSMALLAVAYFFYLWLSTPAAPGREYPLGWYGGVDQGFYLLMAQSIAKFELPAKVYFYGPGYPILAAPFVNIFPYDPFLIPNVVLWTVYVVAWTYSFSLFLPSRDATFASLLLIFATPVVEYFVFPWNSSVTAVSLALLVLIAASRSSKTPGVKEGIAAGALLGWTLSARYVDILFIAPVALAMLLRTDRTGTRRVDPLLMSIVILGGFATCLLASQAIAFGSPFLTPYSFHINIYTGIADADVRSYQLSKILPTFISNFLFHPFDMFYHPLDAPLLGQFFLFIVAPFALLGVFRRREQKQKETQKKREKREEKKQLVVLLICGLGLAATFYSSFTGVEVTGGSLKYQFLHYSQPWYPLLVLVSVIGFQQLTLAVGTLLKECRTKVWRSS